MDSANLLKVLIVLISVLLIVHSQDTCSVENCRASNGLECNDAGTCNCGTCICQEPFSGPTCEECPDCRAPCDVYSSCVSCKVYSTGLMGFFECLDVCGSLATYNEVTKSEFATLGMAEGFVECERINDRDCRESFKIGVMADGKRDLFVLSPMDCTERNRQVIEAGYPDVFLGTTLDKETTTKSRAETTKIVTERPETTPKPEGSIKDNNVDKPSMENSKVTNKPNKDVDSDRDIIDKYDTDNSEDTYEVAPEKAGAVSGNTEVTGESKGSGIRLRYELTLNLASCVFVMLL